MEQSGTLQELFDTALARAETLMASAGDDELLGRKGPDRAFMYYLFNVGVSVHKRGDAQAAYKYHKLFLNIWDIMENICVQWENLMGIPAGLNGDVADRMWEFYIHAEDRANIVAMAAGTLDEFSDPDALRFLNKAVSLDPHCTNAIAFLRDHYVRKGSFAGAFDQFQALYEANTHEPDVVLGHSHILEEMNRREKSVEILEKYMKKHPPTKDMIINVSYSYLDLHRFHDALAGFRRYAALAPASAEAHAALGVSYARIGRKKRAGREIARACTLNSRKDDPLVENLIREALEILEEA